jgi:hypothetical protein
MMTEQFRFEQPLRDCAAIDDDERPVAPRTVPVYGLRNQLLARAAFARDQDHQVGPRDLFDQGVNSAHRRRRSDHIAHERRRLSAAQAVTIRGINDWQVIKSLRDFVQQRAAADVFVVQRGDGNQYDQQPQRCEIAQ